MNISVKNLNLTNDPNNITKAIGTICIDDVFNIEGVTVKRSKEDNIYVQLPQRSYYDKETQEKKYKDACYPTNKELREQISNSVLDTYYEKLKEREDMQEESQKKTSKSVKSKAKKEEIIEEQEDEEVL
ncbi:MAG: septation protein SpoVG family protein [Clostridia bacterium]|nr:septation protein SpoVG family protein [Clostridia bacterium]